jgi:NAD(P)-dependent dehydrogenase (short-subunit alcohol dehydrogenase family)
MTTPFMQGKRVMVTGATDGIGKETARALVRMDAHVIIVGRNPGKIAATMKDLKTENGNAKIDALVADFASLEQIRNLAHDFRGRFDRLDVLVNNAGALFSARGETQDGFEQSFGVNHLAPFLLTNLLLDKLKAGAQQTGEARIINVSSAAHWLKKLNFDDLQNQRRYSAWRVYGQSKLANLLFTYELARQVAGTGITVNALHPGGVASNFASNQSGITKLVASLLRFGLSPEQGAQTSVYLASSPEVKDVTGQYFINCRPARSSPASHDAAAAARLWQVSAELTRLPS